MPGPLTLWHLLPCSWNYGHFPLAHSSFLTHYHQSCLSLYFVLELSLCSSSFSLPSPLFLGNLWDVTDRDIDRYTEALLQGWLGAGPGAPLLYYVSQARQAPRLKYLIGAAPVAYGLPVCLR